MSYAERICNFGSNAVSIVCVGYKIILWKEVSTLGVGYCLLHLIILH